VRKKTGFDLVHVEHLRGSRFGLQSSVSIRECRSSGIVSIASAYWFKLHPAKQKLSSRVLTLFELGALAAMKPGCPVNSTTHWSHLVLTAMLC